MDQEQLRLMAEECILVNRQDQEVGHASKHECHLMENIEKRDLLHRAFSVFLFNSKGEMLLQQRATEKITFGDHWTNTCCSHPLYTIPAEREGTPGAKKAALRKLEHELGIKVGTIAESELHFLTRIIYKAASNGQWGEHEIDHIFFVQKDVELKVNPNEVRAVRYVTAPQLKEMLSPKSGLLITPWFNMICQRFIFGWWENLPKILKQKGLNDPQAAATIHALTLSKL